MGQKRTPIVAFKHTSWDLAALLASFPGLENVKAFGFRSAMFDISHAEKKNLTKDLGVERACVPPAEAFFSFALR